MNFSDDLTVKPISPGAALDFSFDWGSVNNANPWLADGETILTSTWQADPTLTLTLDNILGGVITVVLVEGAKRGQSYLLTNHVTISGGRSDSRVMQLRCQLRSN
jgi:hypothetical protein